MSDVTIPADVAKQYAAALRNRQPVEWPDGLSRDGLADILDPPAPTLREQVAQTMHDAYETRAAEVGWETQARSRVAWADVPEANKQAMYAAVDAALAVVREAIDAVFGVES